MPDQRLNSHHVIYTNFINPSSAACNIVPTGLTWGTDPNLPNTYSMQLLVQRSANTGKDSTRSNRATTARRAANSQPAVQRKRTDSGNHGLCDARAVSGVRRESSI